MAQSSSLRTPQHASRVVPGDPRGGKHRHFILYFTRFFAPPMFYVLRGPRWPQDGHMMAQERPKIPKRAPETPLETSQDDPQIGLIIDPWHLWAILGRLGAILGHLGAILGPSWAVLGRLGPSWGRLGDDLGDKLGPSGHLGRVLEPSWGRLGRQIGAKWPSWARLGTILGRLGRDLGGLGGLPGPSWTLSWASWRPL